MNLYQFNGNNPVTFTDPFGLCPIPASSCPRGTFTAIGMVVGAAVGAKTGGTGGAILGALGGAGLGAPTGPGALLTGAAGGVAGGAAGTAIGATTGALLGGAVGAIVDGVVHLKGESAQIGQAIESVMGSAHNTEPNRRDVGDYCEACKANGVTGTKNAKGDFTFKQLKERVKEFFDVP